MFFPLASEFDWNRPVFQTLWRNLPEETRALVRAERKLADAASAANDAKWAENGSRQKAFERMGQLRVLITSIKDDAEHLTQTDEDKFDLAEMEAELAALEAEWKPKREPTKKPNKHPAHHARQFAASNTQTPRDWIRSLGNVAAFRSVYARASVDGWTHEKVQNEIDKILMQRVKIARTPLTKADALAAAFENVDRAAEAGKPDLCDTVRHGEPPTWPHDAFYTPNLGRSVVAQKGVSFLAWLDPDTVKARLKKEIETFYADGEKGISFVERNSKFEKIDARWLELQRIQAALIYADPSQPRKALHPLALLQIERIADAKVEPKLKIIDSNSPDWKTEIMWDPSMPGRAQYKDLPEQKLLPKHMRK